MPLKMTEGPTKPSESSDQDSESASFKLHFGSDGESDTSGSSFSSLFSFSSSEYTGDELWSDISITSLSDGDSTRNDTNEPNKSTSTQKVIGMPAREPNISSKSCNPLVTDSQNISDLKENVTEFPSGIGNDLNDYACNTCGELFNSQATLDVHKLNHLSTEIYTCEICNHTCNNREDFTLHHRVHEKKNGSIQVNLNKREKFSMFPFQCDACNKSFQFASSFNRHMERHALLHVCTVCNKSFPTELLCHQHKLTHAPKKEHKCQVCGKDFHRAHQLNIHMAVHAAVKEYRCDECDTAYCYKTSLVRHKVKYHSPDAPKFQCHLCGELFKNKKMLNGHEILHTAKKLIQCPDCTQTFKYRSSFHRHRAIHSSEKPFKCSTCGKQFKTESEMKTHKMQHTMHDEFVCKICDKSFAFETFLNKHMLTHDDAPSTVQFNLSD